MVPCGANDDKSLHRNVEDYHWKHTLNKISQLDNS